MSNQQVIGIQRVLTNQKGQSWNNKKLRWSIVHNVNNQSKPYDIELEMVLISSKRILKVNQQVKDVQMCSFGYEVNFDINDKLKGYIKQDSLTFQLFINGKSFTSLQVNNQMYQPPKLDVQNDNSWANKKSTSTKDQFFTNFESKKPNKPQQKQLISSPQPKTTIMKAKSVQQEEKLPSPPMPQLKIKQFSLIQKKQQKKQTQNAIKDTQSQLMRILMQEKKKKKLQQQQLSQYF